MIDERAGRISHGYAALGKGLRVSVGSTFDEPAVGVTSGVAEGWDRESQAFLA